MTTPLQPRMRAQLLHALTTAQRAGLFAFPFRSRADATKFRFALYKMLKPFRDPATSTDLPLTDALTGLAFSVTRGTAPDGTPGAWELQLTTASDMASMLDAIVGEPSSVAVGALATGPDAAQASLGRMMAALAPAAHPMMQPPEPLADAAALRTSNPFYTRKD